MGFCIALCRPRSTWPETVQYLGIKVLKLGEGSCRPPSQPYTGLDSSRCLFHIGSVSKACPQKNKSQRTAICSDVISLTYRISGPPRAVLSHKPWNELWSILSSCVPVSSRAHGVAIACVFITALGSSPEQHFRCRAQPFDCSEAFFDRAVSHAVLVISSAALLVSSWKRVMHNIPIQ